MLLVFCISKFYILPVIAWTFQPEYWMALSLSQHRIIHQWFHPTSIWPISHCWFTRKLPWDELNTATDSRCPMVNRDIQQPIPSIFHFLQLLGMGRMAALSVASGSSSSSTAEIIHISSIPEQVWKYQHAPYPVVRTMHVVLTWL